MHIAFFGKKTPFCGNVTYCREITNALLDRGYKVSFFYFEQECTDQDSLFSYSFTGKKPVIKSPLVSNSNEICTNDVPLPYLYKSTLYTVPTLKSSKVVEDLLSDLKPDLVHASLSLSPLDFALPKICKKLGLPLVSTFHPAFEHKPRTIKSSLQHLPYYLYSSILAKYDSTIVFSKMQQDLLIKLGVPASRLTIIPNGVDIEKYSPGTSSLKKDLGCSKIFIYQGRIATEKNVDSLLKAWKKSAMGKDCLLLIMGNGPLLPTLMPLYGEECGIKWLGFIADEHKRIEILRGCDVFILPSLVEGLSLSLLEAMACGLAPIATDAGADGEVMEGGAGVILRTKGVTGQLKNLLPIFRDQPEFCSLLGQKARQRVVERYTLDTNVSRLEALYRNILSEHSG
jgi:glycosyltransferase involved in cell wall biosynthesis